MRSSLIPLAAAVAVLSGASPRAADLGWPREVDHPAARIVVYQPQLDSYEKGLAQARAAVSVTTKGGKGPVFGAAWFEARADVDRDRRTVTFDDVKVPRVRFPDASEAQEAELSKILEDATKHWDNSMSYDRFVASVAALEGRSAGVRDLRNDPPKILVAKSPALLVLYDGEPVLRDLEGTDLRRVVNTASVVIFDPSAKTYFLYGGAGWYGARDVKGPFEPGATPTAAVKAVVDKMNAAAEEQAKANDAVLPQDDEKALIADAKKDSPKFDASKPPKIVCATSPTELIVFDGEPRLSPLVAGEVLYVDNTASDVLLDVASQSYYVLLSGRWYRSKSLDGPWAFVRPDALPATFKSIPENSAKGDVLSQVAGTPEAEEAVADAQIPQVAAVKKGKASVEVSYDGKPEFVPIPDTKITYAKNTSSQVLGIGGKYYLCDQAIWYVSAQPTGTWLVAESVPAEVRTIPPESPVYNVTYVTVYETTPTVVYVGYTPGYLGYYPYHGTVVWGTGYPYSPWIGTVYYPRPWTWGFHAHYNPYTGWSFGVSVGWSWGWGSVTFGWGNWGHPGYRPPFWGPGGFYPVYRPPYYPPHRPPYYPGYGARPTPYRPTAQGPGKPSTLPATRPGGGSNIYARPANRDKVVSTRDRPQPGLPTRPATKDAKNNVFADKDGNIYRRKDNGSWDERIGNQWKPTPKPDSRPATKPSSPSAGTRPAAPPTKPSSPSAGTRPAAPPTKPSSPSAGTRPATPTYRPSSPSAGAPPRAPKAPPQGIQRDYGARQRGAARAAPRGGGGARRR